MILFSGNLLLRAKISSIMAKLCARLGFPSQYGRDRPCAKITMKRAGKVVNSSLSATHGFLTGFGRAGLLAGLLWMMPATTFAQAMDAIDVQQRGPDAEILIRFATQVLYMRHNPPGEGQSLRIYLRLVGPGLQEGDLIPESRRSYPVAPAPGATIRFPESDGSLSVSFDQATRFSVRPGPDGRSISIVIPAKPGG